MNHSFDIDVAQKLGIHKAIILENILYWWKKDVANHQNYKDGKHRVYNSASAFLKLFPYMTKGSITRYLKELCDEGYLFSGNYNKIKFDKTLRYSPTEKTANMYHIKIEKHNDVAILPVTQNESSTTQNEATIPIINTIINHNNTNNQFLAENGEKILIGKNILYGKQIKLNEMLISEYNIDYYKLKTKNLPSKIFEILYFSEELCFSLGIEFDLYGNENRIINSIGNIIYGSRNINSVEELENNNNINTADCEKLSEFIRNNKNLFNPDD